MKSLETSFLSLDIFSCPSSTEQAENLFESDRRARLTRWLRPAAFWFSSNREILLDLSAIRLEAWRAIQRWISIAFFSKACGVTFFSKASSCRFNFSLALRVFGLSSAINFFLSLSLNAAIHSSFEVCYPRSESYSCKH